MDLSVSAGGQPTGRQPLGTEVLPEILPRPVKWMRTRSWPGVASVFGPITATDTRADFRDWNARHAFCCVSVPKTPSDTGGRREAHTPPALQRRSRAPGRSADAPRQRPEPLSVPPRRTTVRRLERICGRIPSGAGVPVSELSRPKASHPAPVPALQVDVQEDAPQPSWGLCQLSGGPHSHSPASCGVARFRCVPRRRYPLQAAARKRRRHAVLGISARARR